MALKRVFENSRVLTRSRKEDFNSKDQEVIKLQARNKKLEQDYKIMRNKVQTLENGTGKSRIKESFNFSKLKGSRMKGSIDYKNLTSEMKRAERKHRDVIF